MGVFDRLADARTRLLSGLFVLVSLAVFACLVFWAKTPLAPVPAFIPVYESAVAINDLMTAVMLFGLFRLSRARGLWWLSTAYLFTAALAVSHMLTFPGLFSPGGLLGAGTRTTAWLYIVWHAGFPLMVLASARRSRAPVRLPAPILTSLLLAAVLTTGLLFVTTASWMPVVIVAGKMTPLMVVLMPFVLAVGAAAAVVLWLKRPATVLERWLWASLCAWVCEVALSATFNAGRFDLGFYSGRVFGILSSSLILWILLLEISSLYGQVERSNVRLQESDRLKSQFLANVSHEIRTPLNAIIGLSSLELRGEASPRRRDSLVKIRDAGDTLLRLVNDILDLSKIEAGKLTYELTDFSLEKVMSGIAAMFEAKARDKRLGFQVTVAPEVPRYLKGDPLRLGQVLTNLIGNAVKFTPQGEVTASVAARSRVGGTVTLEFAVRDTGIGMSGTTMNALFSAFIQADSSISRRYGGTGLGLAITKQLVEGMGGEIFVESAPGQGSLFRFLLPFEVNAPREHERLVVPAALRGLRTLVVVENSATRARLKTFLDAYPFEIEYAESGKGALRRLQAGDAAKHQLFLIDLWLTGVSGFELLRYLKSASGETPAVILVSSLGTKFEHDEAYRNGADAFLVEPVSSSALGDAVMRIFGSEPAAAMPVSEDSGSDLRGLRVLVVEDNDVNRQIVLELLRSAGVDCDEAASGEEAVGRLMSRPAAYDVVLMDIQMPGMDGYAATRRLRLEPGFADLPIVALSAHALEEEKRRSLEAGMNGHITKPIDPAALFSTMREVVGNRPLALAPPAAKPDPAAGLDIAAGLARVAGNRALYSKLLAVFAAGWSETVSRLSAAWAAGDRGELGRLAHTVRGSAGNLGVMGVADAAEALDAALRRSDSDEAVAVLVQGLQEAGSAVSGLLPQDDSDLEL